MPHEEAVNKPPNSPLTLEQVCLRKYLTLLQDSCHIFVLLCRSRSRLLDNARENALPAMRTQLDSTLSGAASSSLRQQMADLILDGEYPEASGYHNQYDHHPLRRENLLDADEDDLKLMEEIASAGRRCNSVCCTGAFVAETMLAVILGPDVRKLDFNLRKRTRENELQHPFWNKNKLLKKYVTFQVPAVLAHYTRALRNANMATTIKLEKLHVKGTDIPSRQFAARKNHFQVMTTYPELQDYLEIPGELSRLATTEPDRDGVQYGAFSEHLVMSLGEMFTVRGVGGFPRLTEIVLGREACNTSLKMTGRDGRDISAELFRGIGMACPNLKVLDVSSVICLAPECILFLLFHDTYQTLHQYTYLPEICTNFEDRLVQNDECDIDEIQHHSEMTYCPYCLDEWCANGLRLGLEFSDVACKIVDDRIVDRIKGLKGDEAKKHLVNVVTATDLIKSADGPIWILTRPEGPKPWEDGFEPPRPSNIKDWGYYWVQPTSLECHYEPTCACPVPIVRPIAKSLQCLKLNVDALWPKHELVPFLLKVMPNVKSLGHVNVVKGLKMIRDIVGMEGITAETLEELDFGYGGSQTALSNANWADNDISDFVEDLGQHLYDENLDNPEEKKEALKKDVQLVAKHCPSLRRMEVYLYGDIPYVQEGDMDIWKLLPEKLPNLAELVLHAHEWSESVALVKTLKHQLKKLYLTLDGRGNFWTDGDRDYIPMLEEVLDICPHLEDLSFSFGVKRVDITHDRLRDDVDFLQLKSLNVATYMTKKAFIYAWTRCPNLRQLKVESLSMTSAFPQQNAPAFIPFDVPEINRLIRLCPMTSMRELDVLLPVKDIKTAECLIEALPNVTSLGTLSIRVGLPQEDYPSQEEMLLGLAHVMQEMRQFKLWCQELMKDGRKIRWRWDRHGFLESISEIEQLNALIEPNVE